MEMLYVSIPGCTEKILKPNHEDFQCHKSPFNKSALLLGLAYDCKLLHNKSNQSLEQIFETIGSRNTPNEEYSDNWFLHTPMKEEYNTTSVLDLYVNFLDIEAIEKKEREDKKKKEQDRIDKEERL